MVGIVQRRALRADRHKTADPPTGIDVDADLHRTVPAGGLDRVQMLAAVDHHGDPLAGRSVRQLTQRFPVHRRVGHDQIIGPEFGQPERFREREAERSGEPGGQRTIL